MWVKVSKYQQKMICFTAAWKLKKERKNAGNQGNFTEYVTIHVTSLRKIFANLMQNTSINLCQESYGKKKVEVK